MDPIRGTPWGRDLERTLNVQKPPENATSNWGSTVGSVLMSLFAYPGSGHLLYKAKLRGLIWAGVFTIVGALAVGSFGLKLSALYGGVTRDGSLDGFNLEAWLPTLGLVALAGLIWAGAALDVLWLALRSQAANSDPPADLGVDQQLADL